MFGRRSYSPSTFPWSDRRAMGAQVAKGFRRGSRSVYRGPHSVLYSTSGFLQQAHQPRVGLFRPRVEGYVVDAYAHGHLQQFPEPYPKGPGELFPFEEIFGWVEALVFQEIQVSLVPVHANVHELFRLLQGRKSPQDILSPVVGEGSGLGALRRGGTGLSRARGSLLPRLYCASLFPMPPRLAAHFLEIPRLLKAVGRIDDRTPVGRRWDAGSFTGPARLRFGLKSLKDRPQRP